MESQASSTEQDRREDWEKQRDHHKSLADNAFRCGGFKTAIDEYSKAIDLDPQFSVLWSNRSAAHLRNGEKSKALQDARKCIEVDPMYVKGQSRLAAALHSLKRYEQALDTYKKVLASDPKNAAAIRGKDECQSELKKIQEQAFEQKQQEEANKKEEEAKNEETTTPEADNDEDDDEDEDDLLNDFFQDVEEVTRKKQEAIEEEAKPKATNLIKNDRQTLGTSQTQTERLLQSNFEWRNLNPFYVLQLPHDATDDDISRRYKALSLLLHPDKNGSSERAQLAYDQIQKAKTILNDPDRAKHSRLLIQEGHKQAESVWKKEKNNFLATNTTFEKIQEREVMRIFAIVEQKRIEVQERERKFEQRERQQEDDEMEKERKSRKFDKQWRNETRVDNRIGNWRDFTKNKKRKV